MNIIKKIYCRLFQGGFRLAIPILPYREPTIIGSIEEVSELLKEQMITSILLVTDQGIRSLGLTKPFEEGLCKAKIECAVYDETVANPTIANVEAARKMYLKHNCQAILAVGGGSAMDCAKAAGARIVKPNQSVNKMSGILKIHKRLPLLIAVPTTAGTGSETTLAAVITDEKTNRKCPVNDFPLIPRYAVLAPELTVGLPRSLTATTGMDALTHAVEAYIGRSTTKKTRRQAVKAIKLIFRYLTIAYDEPDNMEARRQMLHASYLAGSAFTVSYVGYVHAIAHSLGGEYHTPHGLANSIILPYVLEHYGAHAEKKLARLAVLTGLSSPTLTEEKLAKNFIQKIWSLNRYMDIPKNIPEIQEKDVPRLARYADKEANPLYPVPVLLNAKELETLYLQVKYGILSTV